LSHIAFPPESCGGRRIIVAVKRPPLGSTTTPIHRPNWLLLFALIGACFLASCTLKPSMLESSGEHENRIKTVAAAVDVQTGSKSKLDAFNDQATSRDLPADGGQLVVSFNAEPDTLNDVLSNADEYAQIISENYVHASLLRQNPETFDYEPALAERWLEEDVIVKKDGSKLRGIVSKQSEESGKDYEVKTASGETLAVPRQGVSAIHHGASFTFFLRKDVRFHDGVPLTAADVKFSCDTIKSEYVDDPGQRTYFNDVESCEVLDKYTARITYAKQYFLAKYTVGTFEIWPKHIYDPDNLSQKDPKAFGKQFNESPYNRKPIGAGPYKFERWDSGLQVILTRNDDYWDKQHRGHLDRIVFRFISDPVAALQALKNGEVDVIPSRLNAEQYENEMSDANFLRRFAKIEYYVGGFYWIGWNMRKPPFNDVRVRQAMAYGAIDLNDFLQKAMHGHGIVVTGAQFYFGPAYDHSLRPFPFDPEKAKQLLLQAGWYDRDGDGIRDKDGMPFRFEFLLPSGNEIYERRAALMKENLRHLGIDMSIRELEWATYIQTVVDRKFDACTMGWGANIEDDLYQIWHTSQAAGRGDNFVGFGNAETDRLIEEARVTIDDAQRHQIFSQLQRMMYDMQPYLFLYAQPELGAYDKKYRGVKLYVTRPGYDFTEWYLPKEE
jgi:peptide/nickel transport system substrate-binding protein